MILLRSLAFHVYFYSLTTVCCLAGIFVRLAAPERSLAFARFWVRMVLGGLRRLCGITLVLSGAEYLPAGGAALLASQHQSAYDTLVWMTLLPRPTYVVKRELMRMPLFGPMLVRAGMIGVDRAAGAAALKRLLRDAGLARDALRQIVIFPEGTRVAPGSRVALQPGIAALAARLDLPVIPVATDSGRHWGRRAFLLNPGPIHLAVCPPIAPGVSRPALIAGIAESWARAERGFVLAPVGDNPVDRTAVQESRS